MSSDLFLLLIYVLLALGFSFVCSLAEATLLSITPTYTEHLRLSHPKRAELIKIIRQENIEQSLAAILTLNTIANTVGAILSGAKATVIFGSAWFGVFSALMTVAILFISEIIPKSLGAIYWQKIAFPVAVYVRLLTLGLYPIVVVAKKIALIIAGDKASNSMTRNELTAMVRMGAQDGELSEHESRMIDNLLRFEAMRVGDVMTPRSVMSCLDQRLTVGEAVTLLDQHSFSRLPIYKEDLHDITGFVLRNDILLHDAKSQDKITLQEISRPIHLVPISATLANVLDQFLEKRQHIAVVIDEYGNTSGLISLEDLIETLVGREIVDEKDRVADMRSLARRRWLIRAKSLNLETIIPRRAKNK
jgi:CBS domain containing-hemolysin-like protein